jgi:hypothetical protein
LREHPAPQQDGTLVGITLTVFGFTPVRGFHIESVPQDKGDTVHRTEISQPIRGEEAFHRDDDVHSIRFDQTQKLLGTGFEIPVHLDGPSLVNDTHVHRPGMEVDTTIVLVLFGIESYEGLLLSVCCWPSKAYRIRYAEEEALMSIKRLQATAHSLRLAVLGSGLSPRLMLSVEVVGEPGT